MGTARNAFSSTQPLHNQPLVDSLRHQIRKLEKAGRAVGAKTFSTGSADLDKLLPDQGLVTGTITEWLTPTSGCGAELLSLLAAREACHEGGALVIVDPEYRLHPVAAAAWGIQLENVIVLRDNAPLSHKPSRELPQPEKRLPDCHSAASHRSPLRNSVSKPLKTRNRLSNSLLWAIDQSLRCPSVAAVWGPLGHVNERWMRRFQLSAEQSGAMGLFIRPTSVKGIPGWSEVQFEMQGCIDKPSQTSAPLSPSRAAAGERFDRLLTVRLQRIRNGHSPARPLILQIDFTTGTLRTVLHNHEQIADPELKKNTSHSLRLASQLAHPKTGGRRQRA